MIPSDLEKREAFQKYLRFEIPLTGLRVLLGPQWHFERENEGFHLSGDVRVDEPILFDVEDIRRAVYLAVKNAIPPGALEDWANLLILSDVYEPAPRLSDHERQVLLAYIHELASPSLFNGLDRQELLDLQARLTQA